MNETRNEAHAFSEGEIIAIAAAAATALGGIVIALGRGQDSVSERHPAAVRSGLPVGGSVGNTLGTVRGEITKRTPAIGRAAADHAESAGESVRERLSSGLHAAVSNVQNGVDLDTHSTVDLKQAGSDMLSRVGSRLAQEAARRFKQSEELVKEKGPRMNEVSSIVADSARTGGDKVRNLIGKGNIRSFFDRQDSISGRTGDLLDSVRERAASSNGSLSSTGSDAVSASRDVTSRFVRGTTDVAKDTAATVAWLTLASGIVYFALLSPERREQVKSALCEALEQVRLLALDFRGYEPEE